MNLLLDNTIKVSLVIAAALAFTALLRGRSAAARHWVLSVAVVFSLGILLVGIARLAWFAARARVVRGRWAALADDAARSHGVRRRVVLLQTDHPTLLVTWGAARPRVMLPAGAGRWPDDRVRIVLGHEFAHI